MEKILSQIKSNISTYVPSFPFRKGQGPVYSAIIETLSKGITSMYIEGPTGMGKTFIESVIADAMMADSRNLKTLLLTSKVNLLDQISKELTRFIPHRSHSLYGGSYRDLSGEIVVMTYASYNKISQKNRDRFNIVLMDEAHKGLGDLTRANLTKHRENAVTIGFTASSSYSGTKNLQEFLGEEVYKISIREAIKMGMLCAVQLSMVDIDIEISEKMNSETQTEYNQRLASEIIRKGGNIAAAKLFRSAFKKRNLRGIMFTLTVRQGKDLVRSLQKEGVRAKLITAKTKQKDRKILFDSFKRHEFDVLVGIGVIKEGFDDPGVAVSMFVYPAKSYVDIIQGNGRVLRINDHNSDKLAYVVMPNFVGQKGQVFYHELLDGVSFQEPDENPGNYDYLTRDEIDSFNMGIIKKVSITHEELMKISLEKNFDVSFLKMSVTKRREMIKKQLEKNNIFSRKDLIRFGSDRFKKSYFGDFGGGYSFAGLILNKTIDRITLSTLEEISDFLNWEEECINLNDFIIEELKSINIFSYLDLYKLGPVKFMKLDFSDGLKAYSIIQSVLDIKMLRTITYDILFDFAKALNLPYVVGLPLESAQDQVISFYKKKLIPFYATQLDVLRTNARDFGDRDFGEIGTGFDIYKKVCNKSFNKNRFTNAHLLDLFNNFDLPYVSELEMNLWKQELSKAQIYSYLDLKDIGIKDFRGKKFGIFGTGKAFLNLVLGKTIKVSKLSDLRDFSNVLDLPYVSQVEIDKWTFLLSRYGITSLKALYSIGGNKFRDLDFGMYGSGRSFAGRIINETVKDLNKEIFNKMALVLDWE